MTLNDMERQAMDFLLRGAHPTLETLRKQLVRADVVERDFTGVGFFTRFALDDLTPRLLGNQRFVISDVHADMTGLTHGAGFALFIENGILDSLECFIYEDAWPADARLIRLYYVRFREGNHGPLIETRERDLSLIEAKSPTGSRT